MANEKWRMDLRGDIQEEIDHYVGDPEKRPLATYALLAAVLPHLEAAYQRGEMAGRSRGGYKIPKPRKESE